MTTLNHFSTCSILLGFAAFAGAAPALAQSAAMLPAEPVGQPPAALQAPQADVPGARARAAQDAHPRAGSFVPVLRAGMLLGGKGTLRHECSSSYDGCNDATSVDYEDKADLALAADGLYQVSRKFRFGLGGLVVTAPAYKLPDGNFRSGTESSFMGVAEGYFPTSPTFALTLRGSFGAMLLFPGADHQQAIDDTQQSCDGSEMKCQVGMGPFYGPTGGIGVGVVIGLGDARMRIDLQTQGYSMKIQSVEASAGSAHLSASETITGSRIWAMAGVEL